MSLKQRLIDLANGLAADMKALRNAQGDLSALPTRTKDNLAGAVAEVYGLVGSAGAKIDDAAGNGATGVTWSADKIFDSIEAARQALRDEMTGGASAALDTFNEFAAAIGNDPTFAATMATALNNRVRFDEAQTLTAAQRAQACENIGVGDPETDLLAIYNAAKA